MKDWTDLDDSEKIKILTELTGGNLSASMIAAHFKNCSRNAIIGYCHRKKISLSGKGSTSANSGDPSPKRAPRPKMSEEEKAKRNAARAKSSVADEVFVPAKTPAIKSGPVSMEQLSAITCRWPLDISYRGKHPSEMMFCGKYVSDTTEVYCTRHCKLAYQPRITHTVKKERSETRWPR